MTNKPLISSVNRGRRSRSYAYTALAIAALTVSLTSLAQAASVNVVTNGGFDTHHTNESPGHVNNNFAALLPWVDRLFGTLYLPKDKQPARYGISEPLPTRLLGQLLWPCLIPAEQTRVKSET